jgi:hypothetical protein
VQYPEEARTLWQTYVPPRGQAETVQGELIRAIEKLRDEAQRNGNANWDESHVIFAEFVRDTLVGSELFDEATNAEIDRDVGRLLDAEVPEASDEPYDRLADRVVEWARAHADPVPHEPNPRLYR